MMRFSQNPNAVIASTNPVTGGIDFLIANGLYIPIAGFAAEAYGASPSATAAVNTAAIQAALTGVARTLPGKVTLTTPGVYQISSTLVISSNTELELGEGVTIQNATGTYRNLLNNTNWASAATSISNLSTSDNKTVVAATTTPPAVGSYVYVYGATPEIYNGVVQVVSVVAGTSFSYKIFPGVATAEAVTSPATGTVNFVPADHDIKISGGCWDYNGANQSGSDTWAKHGLYLRRIANLNLRDTCIKNVTKYASALGNLWGANVSNIRLDTLSDGIHILGAGTAINVSNISGMSGDDFTVCGQGDIAQYIDGAYIQGNFGEVRFSNITPNRGLTGFKYYGSSVYSINALYLSGYGGSFSGGQALINLINDPACDTAATINRCYIDGFLWDQSSTKSGINIAGAITINHLSIGQITAGLGNTVGTSDAILVATSAVVNNLLIGTADFYAGSGAYSANSTGIYISGGVKYLQIGTLLCTNIGIGIFISASSVSNPVVQVGQWNTVNCGIAFKTNIAGTQLFVQNLIRNGYQSSPHININGVNGCTVKIDSAQGLTGSDAFSPGAGTGTIFFCPSVGADITKLNRTSGAMCYVTNAAAGTIVQNNVAICDSTGAANSWHQMTAPTLNLY